MRPIILPLLTILALTACTSREERQIQAAEALVKTQLRDPDSAQLDCKWNTDRSDSQKERYASNEPILECAIRARNGFGGYGRPLTFDFQFYAGDAKADEIRGAWHMDRSIGTYGGEWVRIK